MSKNFNEFNDLIILVKNAKFYNDVINKYLENDFITNLNKNKLNFYFQYYINLYLILSNTKI